MRTLRVNLPVEDFRAGLDKIRRDLEIPGGFPRGVTEEAEEATRPRTLGADRQDARHLPFLTIDPPASRDLDQAFFISRRHGGFQVHYAIADLAAVIRPGGALDKEAWRRGQTIYLPDLDSPLHPVAISEGASSLLPEFDRAAVLWTIDLDESGEVTSARLRRALVRSRRAMSYAEAQVTLDDGQADEPLHLLRDVGRLLQARERGRDGISLKLPKQKVLRTADGYAFSQEAVLPVERWNAQVSLLAGYCAARIMAEGRAGILRTLPPVSRETVERLRQIAKALEIQWPNSLSLGQVVRMQDGRTAESAAFLTQVAHALRGAGYAPVDPKEPPPVHGALGVTYAHVTGPLRRLVDRYANEVVVALSAYETPAAWATEAIPRLPEAMADADRRADEAEAAVLNLAESIVLAGHVGRIFRAAVVDEREGQATILLRQPPVVAKVPAHGVSLGDRIEVRLVAADPIERTTSFELA